MYKLVEGQMATGLLTIVKNGYVSMKIIAGQGGDNLPKITDEIKKAIEELGRIPTTNEAYDLALKTNFGSRDDLVVIDEEQITHETKKIIPRRFRDTFPSSSLFPLWGFGNADFIKIMRL